MLQYKDRRSAFLTYLWPAILYLTIAGVLIWLFLPLSYTPLFKNGLFVSIALVGMWRYGLALVNYLRALVYRQWIYPRWKQAIARLSFEERYPSHLFFIIPSYKEEPWVSAEVFTSLFSEVAKLPCQSTLVVATGSDEDDRVIMQIYESHPANEKVAIILQRQRHGKRIAMGHALRAIARVWNNLEVHDPHSVTIFMDGDTYLPKKTLLRSLPFFKILPRLGALTTDEVAYINTKSKWYKDWFNLKFGQRHILFQSQSLSRRVLTLTGRFSMFRTAIVVEESFIRQIENDTILHPLFGKIRFLMGDDKSSWFYLMKHGYEMIYLPDVTVYSLESRDGEFLKLSRSLPFRWYGNTLRNNERARRLKNQPFFIRYLLYDQLFVMWTSLVGITGALLLSIFVDRFYLPIYIAWILFVRVVQMGFIVFSAHPVSWRTPILMLYNQWIGALIKINAYVHLSAQHWSKGDSATQGGDDLVAPISHPFYRWMPKLRLVLYFTLFFAAIIISSNKIVLLPDAVGAERGEDRGVIDAAQYGIVPDDGRDDAQALNRLIANAPYGAIIKLPSGQLDLYHPVVIHRSFITIEGQNTELVSHLHAAQKAAITIEGKRLKKVAEVMEPMYGKREWAIRWRQQPLRAPFYALVEAPNDRAFVREVLGAVRWYRRYPALRSEIVQVVRVQPHRLRSTSVIYTPIPKGAVVWSIAPVEGVVLRSIKLRSDKSAKPYRFVYRNLFKEDKVDGVVFRYAVDCAIEHTVILDSGRNPLVFERCYRCQGYDLVLQDALNKGKGGSGYLRINKSFHLRLERIKVAYLRHIVIQWASAYNDLYQIEAIETDLNFHGGYSHHNRIEAITFHIDPRKHPWPPIYRTPRHASWAPPDGPENIVVGVKK